MTNRNHPDRLFGIIPLTHPTSNVCSADQSPFICEHKYHRRDALEQTTLLDHRHHHQVTWLQVCGVHVVK